MADEALDFLLKLDAQVDGALKMIRAVTGVEDALKKTDGALGKMEKKAKDTTEHATGFFQKLLGKGLEPLEERMKRIAEFEFIRRGVDALIELPQKLIEVVAELGEEILMAAGKMEEARITFKALFGASDGDRLLDYSDELSAKTGILNDQWKGIERTLGNAGFKIGDDMTRATAAVSDLAALSGRGAAGAQEAAEMLARLQNMGEMNPRMLNAFGINRKAFWDELSAQTGVGVKTLQKQMNAGKVDIEATKAALFTVISKKTGKGLGGLGADIGEDFLSRLARLKHLPEQIFESFEKSPGFKHVSDFIDKLFEAFKPESALGQRLIGDLGKIGDFLAGIDLNKVVGALERVAGLLERIASLLGVVTGPALKNTISVAEDVSGGRGGGKAALSGAATLGAAAVAPFLMVPAALGYGAKRLGGYLFGGGSDAGAQLGEGLKRGIDAHAGKAADAADHIAGAAEGAARARLGVHSPSRVFEEIGRQSAEGFRVGFADSEPAITATVGSTVAPRGGGFGRSGGMTVSMPISLHVDGASGDGRRIGDEVIARLQAMVPEVLAAALEQLQIQQGA